MRDAQYSDVKEIIKTEKTWSASKLQRAMKWGYNRTATCLKDLIEDGILSEPNSRGVQNLICKDQPKPHEWRRVEVKLYDGTLLAIEPEMLSGKSDLTERDLETIRAAGRHLLGFAGT